MAMRPQRRDCLTIAAADTAGHSRGAAYSSTAHAGRRGRCTRRRALTGFTCSWKLQPTLCGLRRGVACSATMAHGQQGECDVADSPMISASTTTPRDRGRRHNRAGTDTPCLLGTAQTYGFSALPRPRAHAELAPGWCCRLTEDDRQTRLPSTPPQCALCHR